MSTNRSSSNVQVACCQSHMLELHSVSAHRSRQRHNSVVVVDAMTTQCSSTIIVIRSIVCMSSGPTKMHERLLPSACSRLSSNAAFPASSSGCTPSLINTRNSSSNARRNDRFRSRRNNYDVSSSRCSSNHLPRRHSARQRQTAAPVLSSSIRCQRRIVTNTKRHTTVLLLLLTMRCSIDGREPSSQAATLLQLESPTTTTIINWLACLL